MNQPRIGDTAEAKSGFHGFIIGEHLIFKGMEYDDADLLVEKFIFEDVSGKIQHLSEGEFNWITKRAHTWNELKKEYRVKTTEELFQITSQPEEQCPKIDNMTYTAQNTLDYARDSEKTVDFDSAVDKLDRIYHSMYSLEDDLEELRGKISDIRAWGDDWKNLAKHIITKYEIDIEELM